MPRTLAKTGGNRGSANFAPHTTAAQPLVIFVPGSLLPAALQYEPLLEVIKDQIKPLLKDFELYEADTPPPDYGLELEIEGIKRAAEAAGLQSFHLVEYSGGSSLAFTARYPDRVRTLALIEPGWIPEEQWRREEAAVWTEIGSMMTLPPAERMRAQFRMLMRPGVEPPSLPLQSGPPPPWMAKRTASGDAQFRAYNAYNLDRKPLRRFPQPVYLALGTMSHSIFERNAKFLSSLFLNIRLEVYEGPSHPDPPHRAEPERFARALRELWAGRNFAASSLVTMIIALWGLRQSRLRPVGRKAGPASPCSTRRSDAR